MTSRDFCYWLQGYFEISDVEGNEAGLTEQQEAIIKKHLAMVFAHEIDPSYGPTMVQQQLNALHAKTTPATAKQADQGVTFRC